MHTFVLSLGALIALIAPGANGQCDIDCVGRCYNDYFGVMAYGHQLLNSAPGSVNGWPIFYTIPANSSIDNAAPSPWGAFPILQNAPSKDFYNGTQEVTAIVTWGEYGSSYETSNIIDYGVDNSYIQTDCGGPDDDIV